ncbi:MAG: hypothetical protein ACFFAN_01610 [Promethearchaeota archaeon]
MDDGRGTLIHLYFIGIYAIITIGLILFRILLFFFEFPEMVEQAKDYDFILLIKGMDNGLVNFYDPVPGYDWPPYYLYFWYFIFFPMYLIPIQIGVYVWDLIRLLAGIYIAKQAPKVFKNKVDLLIFYILSTISYSLDAYYNNCNFLVTFFLFNSYIALEKNKKWISGIFFTLATFKINSILFLFVLISIKKIKFKDLKYYLIPFFLICIPYLIFPNYFMKMFNNWCHSDEFVNGLTIFDSILWKGLQPSHLMTISLLLIVLFENIKSIKRKRQFKFLVLPLLIIYYIYITSIVFVIPVFFT